MNPYDSMVAERIGSAEKQVGRQDEEIAALSRAVEIDPHNIALQQACARAMIADGRYQEAYDHYDKMLQLFPRDVDALVNYGLLAARLGYPEEATDSWQKAADIDPNQANAHLYLAEVFDRKGEIGRRPTLGEILELASAGGDDSAAVIGKRISVTIQVADSTRRASIMPIERLPNIVRDCFGAALRRRAAPEPRSCALGGFAGEERRCQVGCSVLSARTGPRRHRRRLRAEAIDWFNYGQFLRRPGVLSELSYACFLRAQPAAECRPHRN